MTHLLRLFAVATVVALFPVVAHAQATRTWVSGVGDDANPCSRTAPCKTFAGAISKTAAGGEISVLDPGGFGAVTIAKSITIDGGGIVGSILSSGVNGISIVTGAERVVLRNLSINGAGTTPGPICIRVLAPAKVLIEHVTMVSCVDGVDIASAGNGSVVIKDSSIRANDEGLKVRPTAGTTFVSVHDTTISGGNTAVFANAGFTVISDAVLSNNNSYGVYAEGAAVVNVERSQINNNAIGVLAASAGVILRLSDTALYNNNTAMACGGGALVSAGNNRRGASPNVVAPACAPTMTIQIQ
jgi:hypothetical protein